MIIESDHYSNDRLKVRTGDEIVVSVQSWFPDNEEPESPITLSGIVTNLAVNLASQGIGILDEGLITLTTDPTWQTSILSFLQNQPESFDYTHAQGYLVYVYFDASLTINENYSGMLQVTSPDEIEELQTQLFTMPGEGFFYTYLTNYSDNLVAFDNLTIRHRQAEHLLFFAKRKIRDASSESIIRKYLAQHPRILPIRLRILALRQQAL